MNTPTSPFSTNLKQVVNFASKVLSGYLLLFILYWLTVSWYLVASGTLAQWRANFQAWAQPYFNSYVDGEVLARRAMEQAATKAALQAEAQKVREARANTLKWDTKVSINGQNVTVQNQAGTTQTTTTQSAPTNSQSYDEMVAEMNANFEAQKQANNEAFEARVAEQQAASRQQYEQDVAKMQAEADASWAEAKAEHEAWKEANGF